MTSLKYKKPSWSFTVHAVEDLDVNRVLRETPTDTPWVVLANKCGEPVLLCIREEYLRRFTKYDRLEVCGTNLQNGWGCRYLPYFGHENGCLTVPKCSSCSGKPVLEGWRASDNYMNSHPMSNEEISRMVAADHYVRKIPVRVYLGRTIGDNL